MSNDDANAPEKASSFLNRWSARKRQTTTDAPRVQTDDAPKLDSVTNLNALNTELNSEPASAAPLATVDALSPDEQPLESGESVDSAVESPDADEPLLTDADMPQLETLTAKSDLSDFFNKGVSETLRRAALRHVFSLPVYNVRDGLNDYDDDYTKFEPLGDTVTSDMKWHKERKEREAREAEEERKRLAEEAEATDQAEETKELDAQDETDEAHVHEDDEANVNEDAEQESMDGEQPPESRDGHDEHDSEDHPDERIHATTEHTETTA